MGVASIQLISVTISETTSREMLKQKKRNEGKDGAHQWVSPSNSINSPKLSTTSQLVLWADKSSSSHWFTNWLTGSAWSPTAHWFGESMPWYDISITPRAGRRWLKMVFWKVMNFSAMLLLALPLTVIPVTAGEMNGIAGLAHRR